MPYQTLSGTKTSGKDEVLSTLQYLSRGATVTYRNGVSVTQIVEYLRQNGHFSPHPSKLAALTTQVSAVLTTLVGLGYVTTTTSASSIGEESVTGYKLTRNGILPARRAKPYALRP